MIIYKFIYIYMHCNMHCLCWWMTVNVTLTPHDYHLACASTPSNTTSLLTNKLIGCIIYYTPAQYKLYRMWNYVRPPFLYSLNYNNLKKSTHIMHKYDQGWTLLPNSNFHFFVRVWTLIIQKMLIFYLMGRKCQYF